MRTYMGNAQIAEPEWLLFDAQDKTLGRLASSIASHLRGKHKPQFTPHADMGDFVLVINAEKIAVTGQKLEKKQYYRHSGYPGGIKSESLAELLDRRPEQVLIKAVEGMLPKSPLGRKMMSKLKVYAGEQHPHQAQQPKRVELPED